MYRQKYKRLKQWLYLSDGRRVERIQAIRSFGNVKEGDIGGFIEDDNNLSHNGNCWIADDAIASGQSRVSGNALLKDSARIDHRVKVSDFAVIQDRAMLRDDVFVYGNAVVGFQSLLAGAVTICDHAVVLCHPRYTCGGKNVKPNLNDIVTVRDFARLEGSIFVRDSCIISGNAMIRGNATLTERVKVDGDAIIEDMATLGDDVWISQSSRIGGRTKITGCCIVQGHSVIRGNSRLFCNVRVGGGSVIENETHSGDEICWNNNCDEHTFYSARFTTLSTVGD
jgi:UDP-3-O-[3-hydroxymyristoyl] glucosamine N-acyltransferase